MLRISKLTDYTTVILSYMARNRAAQHAATEISNITGIKLPTVSKLLKTLSKADIVRSVRGSKGGYYLALGPELITVADVIFAIEGPIALTECSLSVDFCEQSSSCEVRGNWMVINRAVKAALESVTLADMIKPVSDLPVEIRMPVANFLA